VGRLVVAIGVLPDGHDARFHPKQRNSRSNGRRIRFRPSCLP
jgi:hypothetical protein